MNRTRTIIFAALFAALTSIMAQIVIPLPFSPVPLSCATLMVVLSGMVLGGVRGMISQLIYIIVGATGIPVFAGMQGGASVLAGPTGGFIIGYAVAAFVSGVIARKAKGNIIFYIIAALMATIICYIFGTAWYMFVTGSKLLVAFSACVLPFLPGDSLKIFAAAFIGRALYKRKVTEFAFYKK